MITNNEGIDKEEYWEDLTLEDRQKIIKSNKAYLQKMEVMKGKAKLELASLEKNQPNYKNEDEIAYKNFLKGRRN